MRSSRFGWPPARALQHHGYSQSAPALTSSSRSHPPQHARVPPALLTARARPRVPPLRRAALPRGLAVALSSHSPPLHHSLFWRSPHRRHIKAGGYPTSSLGVRTRNVCRCVQHKPYHWPDIRSVAHFSPSRRGGESAASVVRSAGSAFLPLLSVTVTLQRHQRPSALAPFLCATASSRSAVAGSGGSGVCR